MTLQIFKTCAEMLLPSLYLLIQTWQLSRIEGYFYIYHLLTTLVLTFQVCHFYYNSPALLFLLVPNAREGH